MLRRIVVLSFICVSLISLAVEIADVKPSADIYKYVKKVVEAGVMELDENNRFLGPLLITRYDLAKSLAKMMDYLATALKVEEIRNTLNAIDTRIKVMEAFTNMVQGDIVKLQERVGNLEMQASSLVQRIDMLRTTVASSLSTLTLELDARIRDIERELYDSLVSVKAALEATMTTHQASIANLEGVVYNVVEDLESFKSRTKMMEDTFASSITGLSRQIEANKMAIKSFGVNFSMLNRRMDQLDKKMETLKKQQEEYMASRFSTFQSTITKIQGDVYNLESSLSSLHEKTAMLDTELKNQEARHQEDIKGLKEHITSVEDSFGASLTDLRMLFARQATVLSDIQDRVKVLSDDSADLKLNVENVKRQIRIITAQVLELQNSDEKLDKEVKNHEGRLKALQIMLDDVNSRTSTMATRVEKLEQMVQSNVVQTSVKVVELEKELKETARANVVAIILTALLGFFIGGVVTWVLIGSTGGA
ncbi:MAG: hypothetical protein J7L52_07865 [Thermotogae bacterium]|nr:hypothetical protein [Thermotogota bacterium]